jgi:hypothetical protein
MSDLPAGWRKVSPHRYERDDGVYVDSSETWPFWRPGKDAVFISSESSPLKAMRVANDEWSKTP